MELGRVAPERRRTHAEEDPIDFGTRDGDDLFEEREVVEVLARARPADARPLASTRPVRKPVPHGRIDGVADHVRLDAAAVRFGERRRADDEPVASRERARDAFADVGIDRRRVGIARRKLGEEIVHAEHAQRPSIAGVLVEGDELVVVEEVVREERSRAEALPFERVRRVPVLVRVHHRDLGHARALERPAGLAHAHLSRAPAIEGERADAHHSLARARGETRRDRHARRRQRERRVVERIVLEARAPAVAHPRRVLGHAGLGARALRRRRCGGRELRGDEGPREEIVAAFAQRQAQMRDVEAPRFAQLRGDAGRGHGLAAPDRQVRREARDFARASIERRERVLAAARRRGPGDRPCAAAEHPRARQPLAVRADDVGRDARGEASGHALLQPLEPAGSERAATRVDEREPVALRVLERLRKRLAAVRGDDAHWRAASVPPQHAGELRAMRGRDVDHDLRDARRDTRHQRIEARRRILRGAAAANVERDRPSARPLVRPHRGRSAGGGEAHGLAARAPQALGDELVHAPPEVGALELGEIRIEAMHDDAARDGGARPRRSSRAQRRPGDRPLA